MSIGENNRMINGKALAMGIWGTPDLENSNMLAYMLPHLRQRLIPVLQTKHKTLVENVQKTDVH